MKNTMLFTSMVMVIMLFLSSCTQQVDVDAMLKDSDTKEKIYSAIAGDHQMMTEFIRTMMSNEHAMSMMKGNKEMKDKMMGDNNMMTMMKDQPEMMHQMMSEMMKDGEMMGHMMQMMSEENMMSEECKESCMQMMKDKGMSIDMNTEDHSHSEK